MVTLDLVIIVDEKIPNQLFEFDQLVLSFFDPPSLFHNFALYFSLVTSLLSLTAEEYVVVCFDTIDPCPVSNSNLYTPWETYSMSS